jgi:hypothetical protein
MNNSTTSDSSVNIYHTVIRGNAVIGGTGHTIINALDSTLHPESENNDISNTINISEDTHQISLESNINDPPPSYDSCTNTINISEDTHNVELENTCNTTTSTSAVLTTSMYNISGGIVQIGKPGSVNMQVVSRL